jgi:hypothetical protein
MIRSTQRTANRPHRCERCGRIIVVGERYREAVASPHHDDLGNPTWWRLAECTQCAATCGRPIEAAE